jgi:uncharacterized protein YfiM (DUF2279 family)
MKLKIILLFILLTTNLYAKDFTIRQDHVLHFTTTTIMSVCVIEYERSQNGFFGYKTKEDYGLFSIGLPMTFGVIKEIYDNKGFFHRNPESWKDLGFDLLGALFGKFLTYTW